ncbi:MAG: LytTR family transcriptional regulator [Bacteroidetes bacterium]|nr:LytTR family transcriptional regulator [Bacteroidota bacterium]
MLKNIKTWLNKPFPFYETYRQKVIAPFLFALFIVFFLILFNPSHNTDFVLVQFLKISSYAIITFFTMVFYNTIPAIIFPNVFNSEKWNIKKTIIFALLTIISIGLFNGLYAFKFDNAGHNNNIILFLLTVLVKTLTIGVLPTIIFISYLEKRLYKKHHLSALETIEKLKKSNRNKKNYSENKYVINTKAKEILEFTNNDLYCIKSEGNYCIFFLQKNNVIEKKIIRASLKEIEQNFTKSDKITRCHKSYIVNLDKVNDITGNARGYFFSVDALKFKIPGSRNMSKKLISEIRTF